jgi:hypothetical protein
MRFSPSFYVFGGRFAAFALVILLGSANAAHAGFLFQIPGLVGSAGFEEAVSTTTGAKPKPPPGPGPPCSCFPSLDVLNNGRLVLISNSAMAGSNFLGDWAIPFGMSGQTGFVKFQQVPSREVVSPSIQFTMIGSEVSPDPFHVNVDINVSHGNILSLTAAETGFPNSDFPDAGRNPFGIQFDVQVSDPMATLTFRFSADKDGAPIVFSNPVPEPSTLSALAIGLTVLGGYRWRRRRRS